MKSGRWINRMKMMKTQAILIGILVIFGLVSACARVPAAPKDTLSVAELLSTPVYDTQIQIYGKVNALGELMCTCFFLESEGQNIHVWYDTMVEDVGTVLPPVSTEGIKNGDWVLVSGELKSGGIHYSPNDFWAIDIEILE